MKKIFGILSLIAILTVAFSTKAIASDADEVSVEFVASFDSADFVAVALVDVPNLVGVLNVADESVSNTANGEVVISTNIASRGVYIASTNNYAKVFLPFEVGWASTSGDEAPNLNEYVSSYNDIYGYEVPKLVRWISANVGKLTTFSLNS